MFGSPLGDDAVVDRHAELRFALLEGGTDLGPVDLAMLLVGVMGRGHDGPTGIALGTARGPSHHFRDEIFEPCW
jgi:hypothetical protein